VEEKEQVAKSVYIHVWQQAVRGDFSSNGTLTSF
jgi:hypothetical protein